MLIRSYCWTLWILVNFYMDLQRKNDDILTNYFVCGTIVTVTNNIVQ